MNHYYLFQDDAQKGPFTLSQLRSMWSAGWITAQTLYWQDGFSEWLPLSTILSELEPVSAHSPIPHSSYSNAAQMVAPKIVGETTLWTGQASLWNYFWSWFWGILLLAAFGLGLIVIAGIYIERARRVYILTTRKVVVRSGIFVKSTNEIRIKDIRSVNVAKSSISGLIGIGSVEFSSAASERAEIIFAGIAGADKICDMVRKLQDVA
jgi:uncharacterized membrane protein YdbT with pleckstrin-like domain